MYHIMELSAPTINTTQVHHTKQLLSRASVPRKALPFFSTEHNNISVLDNFLVSWRCHGNTKEPSCMTARDCMITWRFSRIARYTAQESPTQATSIALMCYTWYMNKDMPLSYLGHAWQEGCYALLAKIENSPNGCVHMDSHH